MLTLALSPWVPALLIVLFLGICVLLILTVLIQRPQGGGLSGAFGSGSGSGQTAFGAKTGDALTIATISIFVLYLLVAIGLNYAIRPGVPGEAEAVQVATTPEEAPAETGEGGVTEIDITEEEPPTQDAVTNAGEETPADDNGEGGGAGVTYDYEQGDTPQTTDATNDDDDDQSGGQ